MSTQPSVKLVKKGGTQGVGTSSRGRLCRRPTRSESVLRSDSAFIEPWRSHDPVAQLLKPFPRFTGVSLYRNNIGNTNYNALQAKLEERFSRGLSFLISYTRSKLIDEASSVFNASILTGPIANFP